MGGLGVMGSYFFMIYAFQRNWRNLFEWEVGLLNSMENFELICPS